MAGDVLDHLRQLFAQSHPQVVAAYVFGSEARRDSGVRSDVDVAVLFEGMPLRVLSGSLADLHAVLERGLGRSVDLVVLNDAPADLVHRVLRDGRLVLDRNPARRLRFEVAKRNEFFDLEPVRLRYRRPAEVAPRHD